MKQKMLLFLIIACAISSVSAINVSANNCSDTDKTYLVGGYAFRYTDTMRRKTDATSSYQYCISTNVPNTYQSHVVCSKTANPKDNEHVTLKYKGKYTPTYYFRTGTVRYMVNWIYEHNRAYPKDQYHYAGMMLWTGSPKPGKAHIRWSPDSV